MILELLSKYAEKKIGEYVIPGNNIIDNAFIGGYNFLISHFNKYGSNVGAYVCSCGEYYNVGPCGFTLKPSICINCNLPIGNEKGAGPHILAKRKGHYRR